MLRRAVPVLLMSGGAALVLSSALNLVSAWVLLEPSDDAALGFSRGEVWRWFGAGVMAGALMIGWGIRLKRRGRNQP
jgi:hypothetical protein